MAGRPVWRGHLRLALVSCPIALQTVHRSTAGLHFHFLNPATGNRVRQVTVDSETDEELSRSELARGFEWEKGRYVVLDEEDFESARVESSSLLAIDKFVPAETIDPIYYDQSYYLTPDGESGGGVDVYVVLRDAIAGTGKVALSRLVIARRERAVAIHPLGRGLVLHTLHDAADIADGDDAFAAVPGGTPDPDMVDLARQLIDRQTGRFDPADLADRYEARLREVIDAKIRGEDPEPPPGRDDDDGKVVDLMAALRRSLGQAAPSSRRPAARASAPNSPVPKSAAPKAATPKAPAPKSAAPKAAAAKGKPARTAAKKAAASPRAPNPAPAPRKAAPRTTKGTAPARRRA